MTFIKSSDTKTTVMLAVILLLQVHGGQPNDWNPDDFFLKEYSLSKPYGGGSGIPYWDFTGSTLVTNKFVRLTSDTQSQAGSLWSTIPVTMTDWEVQFQFSVHGRRKDLFGDGFAFWYTADKNQLGPTFGSKDYFKGLAIILDTYSNYNGPNNHQHPYISAMVNNGSLHYDHDKDGGQTELAGCESYFTNKDYDTYIAVRYQNYKLTVSTDVENKNEWKECFTVDKVKLPTRYYFGFSAATGDLSDNHDIISVKTYALDSSRKNEIEDTSQIVPSAETFVETNVNFKDEEKSSGGWHVLKVLLWTILAIVLIVGVLFAAYFIYNKQKKSKKRFY